jgi:hypothetical protein
MQGLMLLGFYQVFKRRREFLASEAQNEIVFRSHPPPTFFFVSLGGKQLSGSYFMGYPLPLYALWATTPEMASSPIKGDRPQGGRPAAVLLSPRIPHAIRS